MPCSLESDGTSLTLSAGLRNYSSSDFSGLRVSVLSGHDRDWINEWQGREIGTMSLTDSLAAGETVASASYTGAALATGDVDGDGSAEAVIGGVSTIYIASRTGLKAADADGDGIIDLDDIAAQSANWKLTRGGPPAEFYPYATMISLGDADGDGRDDLLIGVRPARDFLEGDLADSPGTAVYVSATARGMAVAADGIPRRFVVTVGPTRVLAYIDTAEGSYELVADTRLGWLVPTSSMLAGFDYRKPDYVVPERWPGTEGPPP